MNKWSDLLLGILNAGSPAEQMRANLSACAFLVRTDSASKPSQFHEPSGWTELERRFIANLCDCHDVSSGAHTDPVTFARWRAHVLDFEATESGKLNNVIWAIGVLQKAEQQLMAQESTPTVVDWLMRTRALLIHLRKRLTDDWKCAQLPTGDTRGWAEKQTRCFQQLPLHWRYV